MTGIRLKREAICSGGRHVRPEGASFRPLLSHQRAGPRSGAPQRLARSRVQYFFDHGRCS